MHGVRGTNPLKAKKKSRTTIKLSDVVKSPTTKVDEKPAFIKKCMGNFNSAITLANASNKSAKDATKILRKAGTLWTDGRCILTAVPLTTLSLPKNSFKTSEKVTQPSLAAVMPAPL